MYFADFETTTAKVDNTKSWVWLWGIKGGMEGDKFHCGVDIKSFFDTLVKESMTTVYFHNLSFDGNYIYKWLLKNGFKFSDLMEEEKLEDNSFQWICDEQGKIYSLWVKINGIEIQFLDSWLVLMASVEKLGKSIGKEKMDLDYDAYSSFEKIEDVPKEAIDYLERDIDVVIETFTKIIAIYDKKMTRASMAYNDFVVYYNEQNNDKRRFALDFGGEIWDYQEERMKWHNVLTEKEWLMVQKSYSGGYTLWNEKYTNKLIDTPNGVSYDVNSLYPSVMLNYKMPYGKVLRGKPAGEHATLVTVMIQSATLKNKDYPPLIRKYGGNKYTNAKFLKEVSYTEYTFWLEEWEFILDKYDIDYIEIDRVYFKLKWVFDKWLDEKKELKINATSEFERDIHKGIYNSNYGKFAQQIKRGYRKIVEDGNHVEVDEKGDRYLVDKDGYYLRKLPINASRYGDKGQYKHEIAFDTTDKRKHIGVASYITSKARLTLWDAMFKNLDKWIYSDTDSCYFTSEPEGIEIHDSKFGAWKAEHKFTKFKVLRAKCYMMFATHSWKNNGWKRVDKVVKKISGVSQHGKDLINFDNFHLGSIIKGGKRGSINVDGGKLIVDVDYKLGEEED